MTKKIRVFIIIFTVLVLCAAVFTVIYKKKALSQNENTTAVTESATEAVTATETLSDDPVIPTIQPRESETEPLIIDVEHMERDPNPHIIGVEIVEDDEG